MADATEGEAFVLWLDADATASAFHGRVEHVASSRRRGFATLEELARFLLGATGEKSASSPGGADGRGPSPKGGPAR